MFYHIVYVNVCQCMYACMHVCMYVCIYVCVCIHIYIYIDISVTARARANLRSTLALISMDYACGVQHVMFNMLLVRLSSCDVIQDDLA